MGTILRALVIFLILCVFGSLKPSPQGIDIYHILVYGETKKYLVLYSQPEHRIHIPLFFFIGFFELCFFFSACVGIVEIYTTHGDTQIHSQILVMLYLPILETQYDLDLFD